jgi:hydrophobe/amphiphile efflux-1 (HAE1) family protein
VSAATKTSGSDEEIRYFFIRRPVLAAVVSIVITLLGVFALRKLPVNRYPSITPPAVQVTAVYPGANAEDVAKSVAAPIEQQLSGLNGLLYFKSSNSSDGVMNLSIYFDISRNQDLAAVDVQNAIKLAEPQLPEEVRRNGITILKANSDILVVGALASDDPRYDVNYLNNYAKLYVEDELKRVDGVGQATVFGGLEFSMLLSLDPDKMAQLGITVNDVASAVREQNATNPAGRLGRQPSPETTEFTLPVTTSGRLQTAEEFGDIVVRALPGGQAVRVRDLANVTLGSRSYDLVGRYNGTPFAGILIYSRPGANNLAVRQAVEKRMAELSKTFPQGIRWETPFDTTPFITESIKEVVKTLVEAMILVTLVVFLFLQSWRATLIPVLAVPVSIIGTFLGLSFLGFSVNTLTLFALVLAIGIVVDDAIVVIENVERIMEQDHVSPRVAADRAMRQVGGALVAIVLVLCSVFIPVAFVSGITGAMFQQFAVTIVFAVVISGIVALTLTPALCALLLRHEPASERKGFFGRFNRVFSRITNRYVNATGGMIRRPRTFVALFAVILALIVVFSRIVPGSFIPAEDKGFFVMGVQLPDAASSHRTEGVVKQIEQILKTTNGVQSYVVLVGLDILTQSNQTNSATIFVRLKPWDERGKDESLEKILGAVNGRAWGIKETIAFGFNFPEIPGLGTTAGLEMNLQARTGDDIKTFAQKVNAFVQDANKLPEAQGVQAFIRTEVPQVYVKVDKDAALSRGVSTTDIYSTMQALLSNLYVNDFNLFGRTYRVQLEAQSRFRQTPEDIGRFYVRNAKGDMLPLASMTTTEMRSGPNLVTRFNGFPSALLTATPKPGRSSGELLNAVERLMAEKYTAQGVGYAYSGQSFQERATAGDTGLVLGLGIILVFLILAAQYESWSIPFAVLFGLPFGVLGAYLGVWLRGLPTDIYFQVGLITVIGLAAKNAILIVEFATELRAQGMTIAEAAMEAARERFRPILMTSFAFILGVAPLMVAGGAGAASRHSLGTGVFAGMLTATLVGVFFIPLFFVLIRSIADRKQVRTQAAAIPATASPESE